MAQSDGGIKNENFCGAIISFETLTDAKGKKYTAYVIEVKPPWFFGVLPRKVMRRYRQFRKLKLDLVKTFGKEALKGRYELPKKKLMGKLNPKVIDTRTPVLQKFLDEIEQDSTVGMHQLIQDFYATMDGDEEQITRSDSVSMQKIDKKTTREDPKTLVAGQRSQKAAAAVRTATNTEATNKDRASYHAADGDDDGTLEGANNKKTGKPPTTVEDDSAEDQRTKREAELSPNKKGSSTRPNSPTGNEVSPVRPAPAAPGGPSADGGDGGGGGGGDTATTPTKAGNPDADAAETAVATPEPATPTSASEPTPYHTPMTSAPADSATIKATPAPVPMAVPMAQVETPTLQSFLDMGLSEEMAKAALAGVQSQSNKTAEPTPATPAAPAAPATPATPAVKKVVEMPLIVQRKKDKAGVYFKNGQFGDAASMYTEGLELLEERHKDEKKYDAARAVLYNNRALMRLSTGEPRGCTDDCTLVLALEPNNEKALLRRGQGYEQREKYKEAFADYAAAKKLGASAATKHLGQVTRILEQCGERAWIREQRGY